MNIHKLLAKGVILLSIFAPLQNVLAQTLSNQVQELLKNRIETAGAPPKLTIGEEPVLASVMLPLFYKRRTYQPAWSNKDGPLPQVASLLEVLKEADNEGLKPENYHLVKIEAILKEVRQNKAKKLPLSPRRLIDLDLLLTDAFLIYASHLLAGKVNPETIDPEWRANRREKDLASVLQTALNPNRIEEELKFLLPPYDSYVKLREALAIYRDIAEKGGWPIVPDGSNLQKGDRGGWVMALKNRLLATGDLDFKKGIEEDIFNEPLVQAVRRFQKRHGLETDGVVGPKTLAALNVSVESRIEQIQLNLERWRWLPQDLGKRYILVNIANFELEVVENNNLLMNMKAIVGKHYRRTPVFSGRMTYLVLCPYWEVPPKIAVKDILPLVKKNPDHLINENFKLLQGWGDETVEIEPTSVDWSKVISRNFNYRLRQEPGPKNSLGGVKFMFPNRFDVYLHDTPSRELFAKTERTFSSGCIRIEKPIELAEYVLKGDPKWTKAKILLAIDKWKEQIIRLPEAIPLHLLYWTAWADENGTIHFRKDIYGRDKLLVEALAEKPPLSLKSE